MAKTILIALALIAGILAVMFLQPHRPEPVPSAQELLAMGQFVVEQNGNRIITEDYTLAYTESAGYILVSQARLEQGKVEATFAQQYQLNPDFSLSFYQLGVDIQSASQIVSAQPRGKGLRMEVRAGDQVRTHDVPDWTDTFILDNNLVTQYQLLIMAIEAERLDRDFTALVPQALLEIPAHLDGPNRVTFTSEGADYEGKLYTLRLGDLSIDLITYNARLAALFNPAQGTIAYDASLFPHGISYPGSAATAPARAAKEREVTFQSGGVTLAGTLALPAGDGPFPAVLLIVGSGPVDRNEDMPGFNSDVTAQIAASLAKAGIASLRYDKRGVGKSGGEFKIASLTDFVSDARAALAFLRDQPALDPSRIFVLGHSEGGIIAPILAADDPTIAGLILLAAPAHSLDYIIRHQIEELNRAAGKSDEEVQSALKQEDQYLEFVRESHGQWSDYTFEQLKAAMPWLTQETLPQLTSLPLPWLREHFHHDPLETIKDVSCPVLIIQGEKDFQVPPGEADLLAGALRAAGNTDVTVDLFPDLNHLMRHHPEAPNLTYRHLDEPVDQRVLDAIVGWIKQKAGV